MSYSRVRYTTLCPTFVSYPSTTHWIALLCLCISPHCLPPPLLLYCTVSYICVLHVLVYLTSLFTTPLLSPRSWAASLDRSTKTGRWRMFQSRCLPIIFTGCPQFSQNVHNLLFHIFIKKLCRFPQRYNPVIYHLSLNMESEIHGTLKIMTFLTFLVWSGGAVFIFLAASRPREGPWWGRE